MPRRGLQVLGGLNRWIRRLSFLVIIALALPGSATVAQQTPVKPYVWCPSGGDGSTIVPYYFVGDGWSSLEGQLRQFEIDDALVNWALFGLPEDLRIELVRNGFRADGGGIFLWFGHHNTSTLNLG